MKREELIAKNREDMKRIGVRVRDRRKELGLTQGELAVRVGYSHASSIQKVEAGLRNLPTAQLDAIASALFVSSSWLCGNEPIPSEMDKLEAKYINDLMSVFRLLSPNEKKIVIDTAKSIYKNSTQRSDSEP